MKKPKKVPNSLSVAADPEKRKVKMELLYGSEDTGHY